MTLLDLSPDGLINSYMSTPADSSSGKLTVLLIEDDADFATLVRDMLAAQPGTPIELISCGSFATGVQRLREGGINMVLLDLFLPDSHGSLTLSRLQSAEPLLPVIILSGQEDDEVALRALHEGAQDYLVKGQFDGRLLARMIRYAIERKAAELALEYERDLSRALENNIPDSIYFKDCESRFVRVNQTMLRKRNLTDLTEIIGKTDFDFFTEEHARQAFDDEKRIMSTGQPIVGLEEKETWPDGSVTWAFTTKGCLRDGAGRVIGTFGVSRDITALKNIQIEIATERTLLRNIIDNLPDYIYVKDRQGRYLQDNTAHQEFLGAKSVDEVRGLNAFDFFPRELAERFDADDRAVMDSGKPLLNRIERATDKTGRLRWNATSKLPLRDEEGYVIGLVGISRDITDTKLAEEKLSAAQSRLAQGEKTQSLGRLAAGVALEAKGPIATLKRCTEQLEGKPGRPDKDQTALLNEMKSAILRADAIIRGLLEFSTPRDLKLEDLDVTDVIEESLAQLKAELSRQPMSVVKQFQAGLPRVSGDAQLLIQVLTNVMTNAIHSMPKGGELTLRTSVRNVESIDFEDKPMSGVASPETQGQKVVTIEVLDNGCGVPPDKLVRVFEPFFTAKSTGQGTGLGLTAAKNIVELHGGSIFMRNRKEGGASVVILLKAKAD